jgi:cyanophycin synthetase
MNDYTVYTQLIIKEAEKRNIQVQGYPQLDPNKIILHYKGHKEIVTQSITDQVGAASFLFINQKMLAAQVLKQLNVPVPKSILTNSRKMAFEFLQKQKKVVVKPIAQHGGKGITSNIAHKSKLFSAFSFAQKHTQNKQGKIIVQQVVPGFDYRVLIVDQQYIYAAKREPAQVIGDGAATIKQLIKTWNEQLQISSRRIKVNHKLKEKLKEQDLSLDSILKKGQKVYLSNLCNLHQGGIATDATHQLTQEVKDVAKKIAAYFNCPVLGIDFISPDIQQKIGFVTELNAYPGLTIHHSPTFGQSHNVAAKIIEMLFPETK